MGIFYFHPYGKEGIVKIDTSWLSDSPKPLRQHLTKEVIASAEEGGLFRRELRFCSVFLDPKAPPTARLEGVKKSGAPVYLSLFSCGSTPVEIFYQKSLETPKLPVGRIIYRRR